MCFLSFNKSALVIFGVFYSIDALPTLYLHRQYLRANKHKSYEILYDRLLEFNQGKRTEYLVSDMKQITVYLCPNLYKGSNFHFFGIESYYYARVELRNGEHFFLTCLLHPKLDKKLKKLQGIIIERKKSFFPSLKSK